ncbi:MAG TPA: hypothetical protein VGH89_27695 [Pseudonocardia sp.]
MAFCVPSPEDLEAMSAADHEVYEDRLRRMAHRRGLRLTKNVRHGSRTSGCGDYYLVRVEESGDRRSKSLVTSEYGLNLIQIHCALIAEQTTS